MAFGLLYWYTLDAIVWMSGSMKRIVMKRQWHGALLVPFTLEYVCVWLFFAAPQWVRWTDNLEIIVSLYVL